jgi:predicted nucleic acid binding AN1-type Zn finger protein
MYTIVFIDFFKKKIYLYAMENECKKCNVVHSSLAEKCLNCGGLLGSLKIVRSSFGFSALVATTFLSLGVVILNVNLIAGG